MFYGILKSLNLPVCYLQKPVYFQAYLSPQSQQPPLAFLTTYLCPS